MGSFADAAFGTAIATVEELSSVEAAMDIGVAIGAAIGATATEATATEASCPPSCLYATPMVVAVAAMFGAFVQYSAPLQFTNPTGPMHAFTLPAVCESTCAPLLCKWLRVDFYQVVLHPN